MRTLCSEQAGFPCEALSPQGVARLFRPSHPTYRLAHVPGRRPAVFYPPTELKKTTPLAFGVPPMRVSMRCSSIVRPIGVLQLDIVAWHQQPRRPKAAQSLPAVCHAETDSDVPAKKKNLDCSSVVCHRSAIHGRLSPHAQYTFPWCPVHVRRSLGRVSAADTKTVLILTAWVISFFLSPGPSLALSISSFYHQAPPARSGERHACPSTSRAHAPACHQVIFPSHNSRRRVSRRCRAPGGVRMHGRRHAGRRAGAAVRMPRMRPRWPPCGRGRPVLKKTDTDSLGVSFRSLMRQTGSKVAANGWTTVGVPPIGRPP